MRAWKFQWITRLRSISTTMPTFSYCRSRKVIGFHCNGAKMPRETHTKADELTRTLMAHRRSTEAYTKRADARTEN
jgi:hypothetical protein